MAYFNGLMMSVAVICILGNAGTLWHINKYIYMVCMSNMIEVQMSLARKLK